MRILFVHQNFPAQFVHLAPALAARGHEVSALTASTNENGRLQQIFLRPGFPVRVLRYPFDKRSFDTATFGLAAHFAEQAHRAELVATTAAQLRARDGYVPDVVFGHVGWGETLYLADVWQSSRRIVYAEFLGRPEGLDVGFDNEISPLTPRLARWSRSRQAPQLLTLSSAHQAVAPTQFQAGTYPDFLRARIEVIHDGIDTELLRPKPDATVTFPGVAPLKHGDEVLTFVCRNLEPHRGYHIFMRTLPAVLRARPQARVVIVGGDDVSYGRRPPPGKSWKQIFLDEVAADLDLARVHFVGPIPYGRFVALMQVTRVHAYLTYPFVLSWSMLEAMSAGALVIGSRTPPVEEVVSDGVNGRLVDFFDIRGWGDALIAALAEPARDDGLRKVARQTIRERYDLRSLCLPRAIAFVERQPAG